MSLLELRSRFKELIHSPEITKEERDVYEIAIKIIPELWKNPSTLSHKIHEIELEIEQRRNT